MTKKTDESKTKDWPGPGVYKDMPNSEYHSYGNVLSSTGLKTLAGYDGIRRYEAQREEDNTQSAALLFGTAAHAYILEGIEPEVFTDGKTLTSVKAKKFIAEVHADDPDKPVVLKDDLETLKQMKAAVVSNPLAWHLLKNLGGRAETSIFWEETTENGVKVPARCRPDWLCDEYDENLGFTPIIDLKTCRDADPKAFERDVFRLHYDQSAAWYEAGVTRIVKARNPHMVFIAVQKTAPYTVSCVQLSEEVTKAGALRNQAAVERWAAYSQLTFDPLADLEARTLHEINLKPWQTRAADDLEETLELDPFGGAQ